MSDQTVVEIVIHQDESHDQPTVNLKIELEPDTKIQELIQYLGGEERLKIPEKQIVVICAGVQVSPKSPISDYSKINKVKIEIMNKKLRSPPNPNPNNKTLDIRDSSAFEIPVAGGLDNSSNTVSRSNFSPSQNNYVNPAQRPVQNPPAQQGKKFILKIQLVDGTQSTGFQYEVKGQSCFSEIKPQLMKYINQKRVLGGQWANNQQIKVLCNGKQFKKQKIAWQKMNQHDINNIIPIRIDRTFPGGGN